MATSHGFKACHSYVYYKAVVDSVTVHMSEVQTAALVSFAYNIGISAFKKSVLLKKLNTGDKAGACDELKLWVNAWEDLGKA